MRTSYDYSIFDKYLGQSNSLNKIVLYDKSYITNSTILKLIDGFSSSTKKIISVKNEAVGIILYHGLNYIVSIFSLYKLNATVVFINPNLKQFEIEKIIDKSRLNYLIIDNSFISFFNEEHWIRYYLNDEVSIMDRKVHFEKLIEFPQSKFIVFTSGSTGSPNGVILSEHTLTANVLSVVEYLGLNSEDSSYIYTPSGYIYAINQTLCHLTTSALQYVYREGLLFPNHLMESMVKNSVSGLATNPTGLRFFTDSKICHQKPQKNFRYVMTGGQPLTLKLFNKIKEKFPDATIINTYGCTETSARISCWVCPIEPPNYKGAFPVGYPITGTKIKIVDDTYSEISDGEIGDIMVGGPSVMEGYLGDDDLTEKRLIKGWFLTGDTGTYSNSEGLTLFDRNDDVILIAHNKVSPNEIESIIELVPGVQEVGISWVEDELYGGRIMALIVREADYTSSKIESRCKEICNKNLSSFKHPVQYFFPKDIPKNLYGKIDRKKLKELLNKFLKNENEG